MSLSQEDAEALLYDWNLWARDNQLEPEGDWRFWLCLAGRGWGKTRTGAEWVKYRVDAGYKRVALVGRTAADVRDTMIQGESGLLSLYPTRLKPRYIKSERRIEWPNGAIATCYSADEPDQLRGPQHDTAWADEMATWKYPDTWDQLKFGLRLGKDPRVIITTTPRPTKIIKELVEDANAHITKGATYDNAANLAPMFIDEIIKKYEGTRLGRQELNAEILDDNPNALFTRDNIDTYRVKKAPTLVRVVVAIDPAATSGEDSAETGIVAGGKDANGNYYILHDASLRASPNKWAQAAVSLYYKINGDRIVAEVNNGGEMVEAVLRGIDKNIPYTDVHASRGKYIRAEPVAALYEQGKVHHVGAFPELEDQMCEWVPGGISPDRMDALVWLITELSSKSTPRAGRKPTGW
ncbi:terminase family protein [Eubacteriales bacterium OttesenSCG-928-K08]|nr:terminase family protein [Eubacteriales bacterium OttesenSCG-928-K08]